MVETTYTYNLIDALTAINHPAGTPDVTFNYDELGNRLTMTDGIGTTNYTRDALYRPTSIEDGYDNLVGYDYDDAGRLIEVSYPGGTDSVTYDYDDANRLTSVTDWLTNVTTYIYDSANRLTSTELGNGLVSDRVYDDADRLISIENLDGATPISSFEYSLDAVGNRLDMVDDAGTTTYEYDALYQLTEVEYPDSDTQEFTYDAMGNRLTQVINGSTTLDYTYDDADQMTDLEGTTYDYDENGNQTDSGSDTFTWDHENRLVATSIDSVNATYEYNGDGLRTSRTVASSTVEFALDLTAPLPLVLRDDAGNRYVYGLDLLTRINGSTEEWFLTDGLGSTMNLADEDGDVTDTYSYDVFGAQTSHSGSSTNQFSFSGEQTDETGLQYLRARYYDPNTGRFASRDPLPLLQRYSYAGGNPVNFVDPDGRDPFGAVAGAVVGGVVGGGATYVGDVAGNLKDGGDPLSLSTYRPTSSWDTYLKNIGQGAVVGGICGATSGVGCGVAAAGASLGREVLEGEYNPLEWNLCDAAASGVLAGATASIGANLFPNKGGSYPGPFNTASPGWAYADGSFRWSVFNGAHAIRMYRRGAVDFPGVLVGEKVVVSCTASDLIDWAQQ